MVASASILILTIRDVAVTWRVSHCALFAILVRMKVLILLPFYNRPNMVVNALNSVEDSTHRDFELYFIDDCNWDESPGLGWKVLRDFYGTIPNYVTYEAIADDVQQKRLNGSRHGEFMNRAILESDADITITLCDDDALFSDYLANLNTYFSEHDDVYTYCHVRTFNPFVELPNPYLPKRHYFTNVTGAIAPSCRVDSSQVAIRRDKHVLFAPRQTVNLDADLFTRMYQEYGPCNFMGCEGQYKAIFDDQLGSRSNHYIVKDI